MRWRFLTILSLALSSASMAQGTDPLCVSDRAQMPERWRAPAELQKSLNPAAWSQSEAKDARNAVASAADEMIGFFKRKPQAVQNIWDDSVEALIQLTYASANDPKRDAVIRDAARDNLTALISPYLDHDPDRATCDEFEALLPLAILAHRLYPPRDTRTKAITRRTNVAYRSCGTLREATGIAYGRILANKDAGSEDVEILFDLHLWSLWLIEAQLYPDIALPAQARTFGMRVWRYFKAYRLPNANAFEDGARDEEFNAIADLATHIAHIPTGVHRFPLYVHDSPELYRFHRENFYPVMQSGDMDLFASLMDTLRQYGCTPENDVQVRDGTRYLLKVFHDNNDKWTRKRTNSDYDRIHAPWTAALGLRERRPDEPRPGTYGGLVRRWLPEPNQRN
jgi:hypothetical protein